MKILIVLDSVSRRPIGGQKIIYEYANEFARRGNEVTIIFQNQRFLKKYHYLPKIIIDIIANTITFVQPKWFKLNPKINKISITDNKKSISIIPDICIATAVSTVEYVERHYPETKKYYFIQDFENWNVSDDYVYRTYRKDFTNIVISRWLKNIVDQYSIRPSYLISNPIDLKIYRNTNPLNNRRTHSVALLFHEQRHKGLKYAFETLYILKNKYSDLTVEMFGIFPKPNNLPQWINYTQNASKYDTVSIYNSVSVFLCASVEEGFGLTGLEAMACGACLVSTDYRGVREYAINDYNALLSPIRDAGALAQNVSLIFEQDSIRRKLVENGFETVKNFSYEKSMHKMCELLELT